MTTEATHPTYIPIGKIIESKTNPRRTFEPKAMAELTESAKLHGILEPLLVRPAKEKYEIVAGARRYRAAKAAGLAGLPVRVMQLSDAQVLEVQLIENLQREDPHPLEEAEGYSRLLKLPGYNADTLAEKVGKDRSYIYKRIQLTELIEPLKGKFLAGKIQIGHALQLCRLQEPDQIMTARECLFRGYGGDREACSIETLRSFIERNVYLKLAAAPWDRDDAELLPAAGSCTACQKRTGANLALFDDTGKDDRCLDRKCFAAKQGALVQLRIAKAGEKGIDLVKVAAGYGERNKKHPKSVLLPGQYEPAIKSKCAKPLSAIIVAGDDVGQKLQICTTRGCKHHGYRSTPRTAADVWRDKERQLTGQIEEAVDRRVASQIMTKVKALGRHEMRAIAIELLDGCGDDDLKWLAGAVGFEITEAAEQRRTWRDNPLEKAIAAHLIAATDKTIARLIVGILALGMAHRPEQRKDFEYPYKLDRKKLDRDVGSALRKTFKQQRAAAMERQKKARKSPPATGQKAAAQ